MTTTESYRIGEYRVTIAPPDAGCARYAYVVTGPDWWATSGHADTPERARAEAAQLVATREKSALAGRQQPMESIQ